MMMSSEISRHGEAESDARAIYPRSSNDFLCGWGAAFVNVVITYPVNKVMFRQMLHGVRLFPALKQLHGEGMLYLYRGVLPPLFQKTISVSLMFGTYDKYQSVLRGPVSSRSFPFSTRLISPCAAALAGLTEALLTPFERVQTLLQDRRYHRHFRHSGHAARALLTRHGPRELYRGLGPILARNSFSNVIFFEGRAALARGRPAGTEGRGSRLAGDFMSGALLGAVTSTLVYPLNVAKTQMQSGVGCRGVGACATLLHVYRERGCSLRRMYRGAHVNYTRSLISWGIINSAYEYFKSLTA